MSLFRLTFVACLGTAVAAALPLHAASPRVYFGLCDASAVETLDATLFAVADDEENVIRVYDQHGGGLPVYSLSLSSFLGVDPTKPEADVEAAARIGDLIYWITSHGNNTEGKERISRQRFFATTSGVSNGVVRLQPVGRPYAHLLADLLQEPRLRRFDLASAARRPPKSVGALNIEGLTATPEGHLLIGFRNPLPQGQAIILPLLNPAGLIAGQPAQFGEPRLLDLDGLGIRSLSSWQGKYLIVAGSHDGKGQSHLYFWPGNDEAPQRVPLVPFAGFNPESIAFYEVDGVTHWLVVSDDGTSEIHRKPCKKLKNPLLSSSAP